VVVKSTEVGNGGEALPPLADPDELLDSPAKLAVRVAARHNHVTI